MAFRLSSGGRAGGTHATDTYKWIALSNTTLAVLLAQSGAAVPAAP